MKQLLEINDIFQGQIVTRVSDKFCFFDETRIGWKKIKTLIDGGEKIRYKFSPNTNVDWTDEENVKQYYNSFDKHNCYLSNGDYGKRIADIAEIKNGLAFYNGEFYIPSQSHTYNSSTKHNLDSYTEDGTYFIHFYKKLNCWYSTMANSDTITLNIYTISHKISPKSRINKLTNNSNEIYVYHCGDTSSFRYNESFWDGVDITDISIELKKFFLEYYLKTRWDKELIMQLSEEEIFDIIYPLEYPIKSILNNCIQYERFYADCTYDHINYLKLDKSVCDEIFSLINNHLKTVILE